MNDKMKKALERTYDITEVSHLPTGRTVPLMAQTSPKLTVNGYELVAFIARHRKHVETLEQAVKDLEAVLYADLEEDGGE